MTYNNIYNTKIQNNIILNKNINLKNLQNIEKKLENIEKQIKINSKSYNKEYLENSRKIIKSYLLKEQTIKDKISRGSSKVKNIDLNVKLTSLIPKTKKTLRLLEDKLKNRQTSKINKYNNNPLRQPSINNIHSQPINPKKKSFLEKFSKKPTLESSTIRKYNPLSLTK